MSNYRNFTTTGEARDQEWIIKNQEMLEGYIHDEMRGKGFIPVLDLDPIVSWRYDKHREIFKFKVVIKGLRVGKKVSKKYLGIHAEHDLVIGLDNNPAPLSEVA